MPLKQHPTDPDKVVYASRHYDIPQLQGVFIAGFESRPIGAIGIKTSAERIEFSSDTGFGNLLTNSLKTDNGQTIGERNRAELHARLDAWLDKNFMENV
jgi:hypothetical protein